MHLHNFLVDYRNSLVDGENDNINDRTIFVEDMHDNGIFNLVVLNDDNRGDGGRPTNKEKVSRQNGNRIRDALRDELKRHDMFRPHKAEWNYDNVNHIEHAP